MKRKVADLDGAELDAWVAKAEGYYLFTPNPDGAPADVFAVWTDVEGRLHSVPWAPSTDWACGGPIVEREWLAIRNQQERRHGIGWARSISAGGLAYFMRAYVASKFGEEVEDVR